MTAMITIPSLLMIIECSTIKAHYERERERGREKEKRETGRDRERERKSAFLGNNTRQMRAMITQK